MKPIAAVIAAVIAIIALLYVATLPSGPPGMSEAETAQMVAEAQQAIMDRWDAYEAMATEMDLDTWLSYWTEDAWILEPGMDMRGSEIPSFGSDFFELGGQVFSLDLESFDIWVHGDVAYQLGQYDEAFQFPGEDRMEVHNFFSARWVKQADGIWKMNRFLAGPRDAPTED